VFNVGRKFTSDTLRSSILDESADEDREGEPQPFFGQGMTTTHAYFSFANQQAKLQKRLSRFSDFMG